MCPQNENGRKKEQKKDVSSLYCFYSSTDGHEKVQHCHKKGEKEIKMQLGSSEGKAEGQGERGLL